MDCDLCDLTHKSVFLGPVGVADRMSCASPECEIQVM